MKILKHVYVVITGLVLTLAVTSCTSGNGIEVTNGVSPEKGVLTGKLLHFWDPEDIVSINSDGCAGYDNGQVYFLQYKGDHLDLQFRDISGVFLRTIRFEKGRGPGELGFLRTVKVKGDRIYIYDSQLRRVSIFDIRGEYIDEYPINSEIGSPWYMDLDEESFYYSGLFMTKAGVVSFESGDVEYAIEHENGTMEVNDSDRFDAGVPYIDGDSLYMGYYSAPFRIEVYDRELNLEKVIKKELKKSADFHWNIVGQGRTISGTITVPSMAADKRYLYVPFGGGYDYGGDMEWEGMKSPLYIDVFDKKSGEYLYKIDCDEICELEGTVSILGVTDDFIVLYIEETGGLAEKYTPDRVMREPDNSVVVIGNPLRKAD